MLTVYYYDDFGALYALERSGQRYYVGSDHLGTPKVVSDNTGAIIKMYEYDSWGNKTVLADNDPTLVIPVGFASGIPDEATGLVRFGFRDYEPGTGRWTAKDPLVFRSGQLNLYAYAYSDPVNMRDVSGLAPGDRFDTPEQAGRDAISYIRNKYPGATIEYGGTIYSKGEKYTYDEPSPGTSNSVDIYFSYWKNNVAYYHTHVYGEDFSKADKQVAYDENVFGYLGT